MPDASGLLKQAYDDETEESSPDWERIKNFVAGSEPRKKHPITQMLEREQQKVQGFDEGGGTGDFDIDTGGTGTVKIQGAPESVQQPPPQPFDMGTVPPPVAPMKAPSVAAPAAAPAPAPAVPAAATPDATYESQAAKTLGMDPAALQAYLAKTIKPGAGEIIGRAGATLGDAFARAGGSNASNLEEFNKMEQGRKEAAAGIPEKVSAAGKERYTLAQELQTKDANSNYSRVWQRAHGAELLNLGVPKNAIPFIPAEIGDKMLTGQIDLKKALAEIEQTGAFRTGMLGLQSEAEKTRQAEAETRSREAQKGALEDVTKGSKVPFFGPSHHEKQKAYEKLENLGGVGNTYTPDVLGYAQKHGITPEQAQSIKDSRTGGQ